jgi:vitamin B12 transporter
MKRNIFCGVILYFLLTIPTIILAQNDLIDNLDYFGIPTMTITATKMPVAKQKAVQKTVVLTKKEIQNLGVKNIEELINYLANITVANAGGEKSFYARGLGANYFKVLVDGVELTNHISPQGTSFLDLISIADIEHIEIVTGSKGVLYGSQAVAGLVQIFTDKSRKENLIVDISGAQDIWKRYLKLGQNLFDTDIYVSVLQNCNRRMSSLRGTQEKDFKELKKYTFGLRRGFGAIKTDFLFSKIQSRQALDNVLYNLDNSIRIVDDLNYNKDSEQELMSFKVAWQAFKEFDTSLFFSSARTYYLIFNSPDISDLYSALYADYFSLGEKIEWQNHLQVGKNIDFLFGLENKNEIGASKYEAVFPGTVTPSNTMTSKAVLDEQFQNQLGFYCFTRWAFPGVLVEAGNRVERFYEYTHNAYNLGWQIALPFDFKLNNNYASGFRAPTLFEKFDPINGNKALQPEVSYSREWSLVKTDKQLEFDITHFETDIYQKIEWTMTNPQTWAGNYQNSVNFANCFGMEYSLSYAPKGILDLLKVQYTTTTSKLNNGRIYRIPDQKLSLIANFNLKPLHINCALVHIGKRLDYFWPVAQELPSYTIANLSLTYEFFGLNQQVYLNIHNISDEQIENVYLYKTQGRVVYFGYSLKI